MIIFNEFFINKRMHIKNTFINTGTRSLQYNTMKARTRGDDGGGIQRTGHAQ